MDKKTREYLIDLNNTFYNNISDSFSKTRQTSWDGWSKLLVYLTEFEAKEPSILDVGCGNGRFLKFLQKHLDFQFSYTGVDSNKDLLNEAKEVDKTQQFLLKDCISKFDFKEKSNDFVVAFGISHHIPGMQARSKWFLDLGSIVKNNGYFVVSNWNFLNINKHKNVKSQTKETMLVEKNMETGDYIINWQNSDDFLRYCHLYSAEEMAEISDNLKAIGLKLVNFYEADGRTGDLNSYYIYKRE